MADHSSSVADPNLLGSPAEVAMVNPAKTINRKATPTPVITPQPSTWPIKEGPPATWPVTGLPALKQPMAVQTFLGLFSIHALQLSLAAV